MIEGSASSASTAAPLDLARSCSQSATEVLHALGTTELGLTSEEAGVRRRTFGANVLAKRRVTVWGVLARQLRNPLLILLLAAARDASLITS